MRTSFLILFPALAAALFAAPGASVTVRNPIDIARPNETIVLDAGQLRTLLPVDDVRKVHVRAEGSDKDLLVQAVDTNDDGVFEQLLFQADFAPKQTRAFLLTVGDRQLALAGDYKTYGRFVRERRDDFAWENDRIAHRMYGKELETFPRDKLISSSVDVWTKRVRNLVINNWYMVDDYHKDRGEGADLYAAGATRGNGGTGIWVDGKLYPSANFRDSKVYAVGPIRVLLELTYDAWDAAGLKVSEKKRVSLDAGQNLDRFESHYTIEGNAANLTHAIGIRKLKTTAKQPGDDGSILVTWEPVKEGGELGQAVIVDPTVVKDQTEDNLNYYVLTKIQPGAPCVSYSGFAWTLAGDFKTAADWERYVADFAARLRSPLEVKIEKR
jgi:pectinesterase